MYALRHREVWALKVDRRVWLVDKVALLDDKMVNAPIFTTISHQISDKVRKNVCHNTNIVLVLAVSEGSVPSWPGFCFCLCPWCS